MIHVNFSNNKFGQTLKEVGRIADSLGYECYVVGGFVRDFLLNKDNDDLDFVVVGKGLEIAKAVADYYHTKADLYESYGTAKVNANGYELEFVGARREFYHRESRKPIVENGTLKDDLDRRDFTINDIAICINEKRFGEIVDPNNGRADLRNEILRCVGKAAERFDEDPLRMLRAVRFAARFNFKVDADIINAIKSTAHRIKIISGERIVIELLKIIGGNNPVYTFDLLNTTGLLKYILPELTAIQGVTPINGVGHKDIYKHTIQVFDSVCKETDDVWIRFAALLHDIGKAKTKKFVNNQWTFEGHAEEGAKMVEKIFRRMGLPLDNRMALVKKLVQHHMHPHNLCSETVTDSGIRRLLYNLGDDIDALMILCNADITSGNAMKVKQFKDQYVYLVEKMKEVEEKDHIRNFQPCIDGNEIMSMFDLKPSKTVGILKDSLKDAVLDGIITNDYESAKEYLHKLYNTISK